MQEALCDGTVMANTVILGFVYGTRLVLATTPLQVMSSVPISHSVAILCA